MKKFISLFCIRQEPRQGRMEYLDFLRGCAMILVLLQHANVPYGNWILAFHMPLFFVLSGYLEAVREKQESFGDYVRPKLQRLVVPYFLFEAVNLAVWMVLVAGDSTALDFGKVTASILLCTNRYYVGLYGRLWFWPCLFVCEVYFYGIRKITHGRKPLLWLSAAVMLGLSWCTVRFLSVRLPFAADSACMAAVFFITGYNLKDEIRWLIEKRHFAVDVLICGALLFVLRMCVLTGQGYYLMFENLYGPFLWSVAGAFAGSFAFLILAKWLYRILCRIKIGKNLILWYGNHSLAVFPVHMAIKAWLVDHLFYVLLESNLGIILRMTEYVTRWYVLFGAMLVFSVPIANLITQYMPFLLGKFPSRIHKSPEKSPH